MYFRCQLAKRETMLENKEVTEIKLIYNIIIFVPGHFGSQSKLGWFLILHNL